MPISRKRFMDALNKHISLQAEKTRIEQKLDDVKPTLLQAAMAAHNHRIETPTHTVQAVETMRKTLNKTKLIELGVTPLQLATATTESTSLFVRVTARKAAA